MKKLLLMIITAFNFLLAGMAFAESELPDMKKDKNAMKANCFYLKLQGGVGKLLTSNRNNDRYLGYSATEFSTKANNTGIFSVAAGYYALENIRAELSFDVLSKIKSKDSLTSTGYFGKNSSQGSADRNANITAALFSGYLDSEKMGNVLQFFIGSGIGLSQIREKVDLTIIKTEKEESYEFTKHRIGPVEKQNTSTTSTNTKGSSISLAYHFSMGVVVDIAKGIKAELAYSWRDYGTVEYGKHHDTHYHFPNEKTVIGHKYSGHSWLAGLRFDL